MLTRISTTHAWSSNRFAVKFLPKNLRWLHLAKTASLFSHRIKPIPGKLTNRCCLYFFVASWEHKINMIVIRYGWFLVLLSFPFVSIHTQLRDLVLILTINWTNSHALLWNGSTEIFLRCTYRWIKKLINGWQWHLWRERRLVWWLWVSSRNLA